MNSQNGSVFENKTEKNIEEVTLLPPFLQSAMYYVAIPKGGKLRWWGKG